MQFNNNNLILFKLCNWLRTRYNNYENVQDRIDLSKYGIPYQLNRSEIDDWLLDIGKFGDQSQISSQIHSYILQSINDINSKIISKYVTDNGDIFYQYSPLFKILCNTPNKSYKASYLSALN